MVSGQNQEIEKKSGLPTVKCAKETIQTHSDSNWPLTSTPLDDCFFYQCLHDIEICVRTKSKTEWKDFGMKMINVLPEYQPSNTKLRTLTFKHDQVDRSASDYLKTFCPEFQEHKAIKTPAEGNCSCCAIAQGINGDCEQSTELRVRGSLHFMVHFDAIVADAQRYQWVKSALGKYHS
jgi:hypothetical protein